MAKKITLKNKNGDVLCPHTAIEQVQGLKEALDDKLGKTEKAVSATVADSATKASKLITTNWSGTDVNNRSNSEGVIEYHSMLPNTTANIPTANGYQNSVMSFGLLSNGVTAQMFFSKDKPLYYRSSHTGDWKQIATTDSNVASAKTTKVSKASEVDPNAALSFYAGQAAPSTTPTADKVYVGSSVDGSIISVPKLDGSASMANYMNLRMSFNSKFFHEIAVLPNNNGIYHRNVRNGNALEWKQLLEGLVTTSKIADTAITPAKIQTSIALNGTPSMTVEPTTSSPDKTIASVGLVKKAVENIEIGGVNLILNSDFSSGTEHWSLLNNGSLSAIEGVATFTLEAVANGQGMILTSPVDIVSGQQYTVSFDVRSEDVQTLNYCFLIGVGVGNVSLSGLLSEDVITPEWQRIKRTFTASVSGTYKFGFGIQKLTETEGVIEFQFKKLKIEKGNKATDWSPAPEDIVNGIEIGGRNLALDSNVVVENNTYVMYKCNTSEDLETDREYTMTIWGTLGSDRDSFRLYDSGVSNALGTFTLVSLNKYVLTFKYKGNYPRLLNVLQFNSTGTSSSIIQKVKLERGNKATDWSPAPEDVQANISNAETRSKAFAEDYANAEIDKIENGQTVAQKANSLYDDDSGTYKNWGEIDTAITRKIGNKFEDYATKSYVQEQISNQVAVPIASETEDGKVKLATPEDVTAVENDISAVNDSAKAVTPYTLKEYIASKNFATSGDISSAVTAAKTTIFFQVAQPAGGKDGDIWIKP